MFRFKIHFDSEHGRSGPTLYFLFFGPYLRFWTSNLPNFWTVAILQGIADTYQVSDKLVAYFRRGTDREWQKIYSCVWLHISAPRHRNFFKLCRNTLKGVLRVLTKFKENRSSQFWAISDSICGKNESWLWFWFYVFICAFEALRLFAATRNFLRLSTYLLM